MDRYSSREEGAERQSGDFGSLSQATSESAIPRTSNQAYGHQKSSSFNSVNQSPHRQSFAENLRNAPQSPRNRHPSFTQAAVQDLLNHPPSGQRHANPRFAGRQWGDITVGELVSPEDVKWIDLDRTVEDATKELLTSKTSVVLVRENSASITAVSTFDYTDLNAYLLLVVGLAKPEPEQMHLYQTLVKKAQEHENITVREIQPICRRGPLVGVSSTENLSQAIEMLGSGIHRLLVSDMDGNVAGVMSQLRMVDFFWNEGINFPAVDRLYPAVLRDLSIGAQQVMSVNSDAPLSDALMLMNEEGLSSVAVVDNGHNVVGNISTKDVRHLTTTSSAPLLNESCMHFISVILNERGVERGKDAFPVFYVNPYSTLAHTVAKLVATRSHRMWVVESASPSPSAPATPLIGPQGAAGMTQQPAGAQASPSAAAPAVPASSLPGARLSGKLTGVISLTDVLNIFARFTGLHPTDPGEQRASRRRSSSSSVRPSLESSTRV